MKPNSIFSQDVPRTLRQALALCGLLPMLGQVTHARVEHDAAIQQAVLSDGTGNLVLRLRYDDRCVLDSVQAGGRETIDGDAGVCSGIKVGGQWFTTRAGISAPHVAVDSNGLTVTGIRFAGAGLDVTETWRFTTLADSIVWRVERQYHGSASLEDCAFPVWTFADMQTWTGALLGHGGVAWGKLFDAPNASYGVHNGNLTFWNRDQRHCLRILSASPTEGKVAVRFTRQPNGRFTLHHTVSEREVEPRHGLSRFRRDRQDIWRPFEVRAGLITAEFALSAPVYNEAYDRGALKGVDESAVREICHTIARIGAVDERIMGSNGYYSDCAVLHEPWLAQLGLAINDPAYHRAFAETIDFQRQHGIGPDGRVKPRWAGHPGDEIPGTYDPLGYYECQWGWLMDSQTSWVINVAEQFDFTGDRDWLQRQQGAGEKVLEYLLHRDSDGDGLVEMMTGSHREAKGSDWIDVVWAAHENALVNAQLFWALTRWAEVEEELGNAPLAQRYREFARRLRARFNQTTDQGGFWDPQRQFYVYWRDKDESIYGTNLVVPVNFSAIGYGLCDDPGRRAAVLDRIESLMEREGLFFWPLCFYSYAKEEGHPQVNWPFPSYENGDLFLAWGELGTRAYALHNPAVALKYVQKALTRYAADGLAFQRYLRRSQAGAGNDILANNCSIVVGLYRNLYGLQPKHNRLYLEPHLIPELNGTHLHYPLRGQTYRIDLSVDEYAASAGKFTVRSRKPFAVAISGGRAQFYSGASPACALEIAATVQEPLELAIHTWPERGAGVRRWSVIGLAGGVTVRHAIAGLAPSAPYTLLCDGAPTAVQSDATGRLTFERGASGSTSIDFELQRVQGLPAAPFKPQEARNSARLMAQ